MFLSIFQLPIPQSCYFSSYFKECYDSLQVYYNIRLLILHMKLTNTLLVFLLSWAQVCVRDRNQVYLFHNHAKHLNILNHGSLRFLHRTEKVGTKSVTLHWRIQRKEGTARPAPPPPTVQFLSFSNTFWGGDLAKIIRLAFAPLG